MNNQNNFWDKTDTVVRIFEIIINTIVGLSSVVGCVATKKNVFVSIIIVGISVGISFFLCFLLKSRIKAMYRQWRYGRIRGLWADKALKKQVTKCFTNSKRIRLKVTRGTELVDKNGDDTSINIVDELKYLRDNSNSQNPINIHILLVAPCFKIKHVQKRYKTHESHYKTKLAFLDSWQSTLEKLMEYEADYCKISVRFYYGGHSRWRFYICSSRNDANQIILLSNYDDSTPGSTTPMYKIFSSEKNIGDFMKKYFDEIWKTAISLEDYINHVKTGKCIRLFCEDCNNNANIPNICEANCAAATCTIRNECMDSIAKWENFLNNLSSTQRINIMNEEIED